MIQFQFNSQNGDNSSNIAKALNKLYSATVPIIICIGSDLVVGDSLGPLVGNELNKKLNGKAFIYGTLDSPITAKEAAIISKEILLIHPRAKILVIDAAVGNDEDVGYIKITNAGIKPGLGVNKNLPLIGNVSIIGIVAAKSKITSDLNGITRFKTVFKMTEDITNGILKAIL